MAAGPIAPVWRGRQLLGARRDGQGAGGNPGDGLRAEAEREAPGGGRELVGTTRPTGSSGTCGRSSASAGSGGRGRPTATKPSPRGAASSRRWPSSARWCSSSRTCTGRTTDCSTSSTTSSSGPAASRSSCVCTARPELLERRSDWGGGKLNALTVSLSPLSDDETARLLAALLERPLLEADLQQGCSRMPVATRSTRSSSRGCSTRARRAMQLGLPETVQGIIAARLDSLSADEKALLQNAAVLGKVFWRGALADDRRHARRPSGSLHALERKGFVQRARRSSVAGETEYAFRHLLVRDVAYGQIPRASRADKHRQAAEWIELLGRPEDHAEMLAHHYSERARVRPCSGAGYGRTCRTRPAGAARCRRPCAVPQRLPGS